MTELLYPSLDTLPHEAFWLVQAADDLEAPPSFRMQARSAVSNAEKNARTVRHFLQTGAMSFGYTNLFDAFWAGLQPLQREDVWLRCAFVVARPPISLENIVKTRGIERRDYVQLVRDLRRSVRVDREHYHLDLYQLLVAYAAYNKVAGYQQGMNFIASMLIFHVRSQSNRFWLFDWIVNEVLPFYFTRDVVYMHIDVPILRYYVGRRLPDLFEIIDREPLICVNIVSRWFPSLYVARIKHHAVARIWDIIMARGAVALFELALRILKRWSSKFAAATELVEALQEIDDWLVTLDNLDELFLIDIGNDIDPSDLRLRRASQIGLLRDNRPETFGNLHFCCRACTCK
jgi:hypothetical protein